MKKKHARRIREIADTLKEKRWISYEWVPISGEDMLLSGHKTFNGTAIRKDGMYEMRFPVFHTQSMEKELKRSFTDKGENGIYQVVFEEHKRRLPEKHRSVK